MVINLQYIKTFHVGLKPIIGRWMDVPPDMPWRDVDHTTNHRANEFISSLVNSIDWFLLQFSKKNSWLSVLHIGPDICCRNKSCFSKSRTSISPRSSTHDSNIPSHCFHHGWWRSNFVDADFLLLLTTPLFPDDDLLEFIFNFESRCFSSYLWQSQQKKQGHCLSKSYQSCLAEHVLDKEIRIPPKPLGQRYDWKWLEAGLVSLVGFRS